MTAPKKRPSARRGRDEAPAPKPPLKIAYKEPEPPKVTLAHAVSDYLDAQDDDYEEDKTDAAISRMLDHVRQKSVDCLRVGDKRGEELMDELHRELEMLR